MLTLDPFGCPCCDNCCDNPKPHQLEHDEPTDDSFCEDCYGTACGSCGAQCWCDL